jgi:hypothetical protein
MVEVLETSRICGAGLAAGFKVYVGTFVGWQVRREVVPLVSDWSFVRVEEFEEVGEEYGLFS